MNDCINTVIRNGPVDRIQIGYIRNHPRDRRCITLGRYQFQPLAIIFDIHRDDVTILFL